MEKVIDGITYVNQKATFNCKGCVGYTDEDLCEKLGEPACSSQFIFTSLTSLGEVAGGDVAGIKYDNDKLKYSLIPSYALEAVAQNLTDGLKKYPERDNWMKVDSAQERYMDALYRHLEAHRKGEIYDTDNINPENTHMAAVVANAMFLLEFLLNPELNKGENK